MVLIVLTLIWFNKESAPYIVVFIMVFPVLYDAILGSMKSIDKGILEMADLYKIRKRDKILKIYFPAIKFSLISILSSTISLGFKIVIAGEVYGQPLYGIGAMIQNEKVNFNTTAIFAWIIIIVIISSIIKSYGKITTKESIFMEKINKENIISIKNINKKFNNKVIFEDFNIDFYENQVNCIIGKSGCGKSTLLNIISGIIKNDDEKFETIEKYGVSYIFQEDRLIDWLTVEENITLVVKKMYDKKKCENLCNKYLRFSWNKRI